MITEQSPAAPIRTNFYQLNVFLCFNKFAIYEPKHNNVGSYNLRKTMPLYTFVSLKHWWSELTSSIIYMSVACFTNWPPASPALWLWHFHINVLYYKHSCHLVFHESTISWHWKLEELIIHKSGKCCALSFPVTPPSFHPSLIFSSPPLPSSPLNTELKRKEPNHPKKKGQHPWTLTFYLCSCT